MWPIRSTLFVDHICCHGVQICHMFSGSQHFIMLIIAFLGDNSVVAVWPDPSSLCKGCGLRDYSRWFLPGKVVASYVYILAWLAALTHRRRRNWGAGGPNIYAWDFISIYTIRTCSADRCILCLAPPTMKLLPTPMLTHVCTLTSAIYINCLIPIVMSMPGQTSVSNNYLSMFEFAIYK